MKYRGTFVVVLILCAPLMMAHHPNYPAPLSFESLPAEPPGDWMLEATMGIVSGARPQEFSCKEAFGVEGKIYSAILGTDHFAVASNEGVAVSFDGCHLDKLHPLPGWVLALDGDDKTLVVLASDFGDDRLYVSDDGGETLELAIDFGDELTVTEVKLFSTTQAVVSAFVAGGPDRGQARIGLVDLLTGQMELWESAAGLRFPYLFAVGAGQVAWAARGASEPYIVWGPPEDPGRHQSELPVWPLAAGFDEQSGQLWVGGLTIDGEGAAIATEEGLTVDPRLEGHHVNCIVPDAGGVWICSDGFFEYFEIWRLDDDDEAPQPFYRLAFLEGIRSDCGPETDVARICPAVWELVQNEIARRELPNQGEEGNENQADPGGQDEDDPPEDEAESESKGEELKDWVMVPVEPEGLSNEDEELERNEGIIGCHQQAREHPGAPWAMILAIGAFIGLWVRPNLRRGRRRPGW